VLAIAPTFGWINLEDIKAPECFYIEEQLKKRCPIPVFHDDQHGTAIIMLAWLINACKVVAKHIASLRVVVQWAGAAWIAVVKLLARYWVQNIITFDSQGPLVAGREKGMNPYKEEVAVYNRERFVGSLHEWIVGADVFIWLSGQKNSLTRHDIARMSSGAIVFATSNPDPEIHPDEALAWWAAVVWTWRSDFPNQLNNVLVFPWLFRGILEAGISSICDEHKIAAAESIAAMVPHPTSQMIVPDPLTPWVSRVVADAVKRVRI
jgi:malate dehydrogenase (oxaloacetate-decarboxylating)